MEIRRSISAPVAIFSIAMMLYGAPTSAQVYRYVDQNGKVHYTERPPAENAGRAMDKLSGQGVVVKRIGAAPTAEDRAAEAEARKKKAEDDAIQRVEQRKIQAIMSAYSSEQDLEAARMGALNPVLEVIAQTEGALANNANRLDEIKPEVDSFAGKVLPGKLRNTLRGLENEQTALKQLLEAKRTQEQAINARFDEDRRRYAEGAKEIAAMRASRKTSAPTTANAATK
jgi:Domain of unknown function (DUF4124)